MAPVLLPLSLGPSFPFSTSHSGKQHGSRSSEFLPSNFIIVTAHHCSDSKVVRMASRNICKSRNSMVHGRYAVKGETSMIHGKICNVRSSLQLLGLMRAKGSMSSKHNCAVVHSLHQLLLSRQDLLG